jgi:hypothetical protein
MQNAQPTRLNQEELEKDIQEVNDLYTSTLEELSELDASFREAETNSFRLLQNLYKQYRHTDANAHSSLRDLDREYENSLGEVRVKRDECYEKQTACFRHLQKLRGLQNTYLVGLINGLKLQIEELKKPETPSISDPATRVNNLV